MPWLEELDRLPAGLAGDDVRVAIAEQADPVAWPDGATFVEANLPAALAKLVRRAWHRELEGARIVHLFRHKLGGTDGCRVIARAQKAGGLLAHLARVDFVIVYSYQAWGDLTLTQRCALIDHELSHCGKDDHGWITVPHDLSEFGTVVRRFGPWHSGIKVFQTQLELFTAAAAGRSAREEHQFPDAADDAEDLPETLHSILLLVQHRVEPEVIASWTDAQRAQAEQWAAAVHLKASDNDDVRVPPYPAFLEPFQVRDPDDAELRPGLALEDGATNRTPDDGDSASRKRRGRRKGSK